MPVIKRLMKRYSLKDRLACAVLYGRAKWLLLNKDYAKALKILTASYLVIGEKPPSIEVLPEQNITLALLYYRVGEFGQSRAAAELSIDQLIQTRWKYTAQDRQYLRYYCAQLIYKIRRTDGRAKPTR